MREKLVALALALLSGVLYALALAPEAPPALAWIALVPLFAACARAGPRLGAACGAVFAGVASALLTLWFPGMLERYFGLAPTQAWLGWLGLAICIDAPPYALLGAWLGWQARRAPVPPLLVGAGWLLAELLRSYGPVPAPFALLATSQLDTPWVQSADAIGAFGVGALVATGNAVLASMGAPVLRGRRPRRDLAFAAAMLLAAMLYGSDRLARAFADGPPLRVVVVQPDPGPGSIPGEASQRFEQLLALTSEAAERAPDLVFWPESAVGFYPREPGAARARLLALTRSLRADLLLGAPHYRNGEPSTDYYSSVFALHEGRVTGRYDKIQLVPFADYAPSDRSPTNEPVRYRPGSDPRPLAVAGVSVGAFLCGEVLFPEVARALAQRGAGILANPSNDEWFGAPAPANHQLRAAALRAIENRRPLVRPTTGGYSAVIDAHGRILARSGFAKPAVLEARVRPSNATTLHQRAGSAVGLGAAGALALASFPRRRRSLTTQEESSP